MKINKRTLSCIATLLIIAIVVSPSIIQRAMILDDGDGDGDDDSFLLMTPLSESNKTFPNDFFTYITEVDYIAGEIAGGHFNNLDELKYDDDELYEIQGEWYEIGGYNWSIEFKFDIDFETYYLDFYDLFLYLKIDPFISLEIIYFQAFSDNDWINITEITNQMVEINRSYLTKTTKFRLFGFTLSQRFIYLEYLYLLMAHHGKPIETTKTNNINIGYTIMAHSGGREYSMPVYSTNWWTTPSYNTRIYQRGFSDVNGRDGWSEIEIEMELSPLPHKIRGIEFYVLFDSFWDADDHRSYCNGGGKIWNYTLNNGQGGWVLNRGFHHGSYQTGHHYNTFQWNLMDESFVQNNKWRFKIGITVHRLYSSRFDIASYGTTYYANSKVYYDDSIYPNINDIYTNPISPISTLQSFEIKSEILCPEYKQIAKAQYFIEDVSTEWGNMSYDFNDIWTSDPIPVTIPNGEYIFWINATDENGLSSLNSTIIEFYNSYPQLSFLTPSEEGEKVDQFYNYNINISIYDSEGDGYEPIELLIYENNISEPILDWTTLEFSGIDNSVIPPTFRHYWNYTINPIDYKNGLYIIRLRTNDSRQFKIYQESTILIQNNPPSIEILLPFESELITPMDWFIECNITNEDPINTAQWDIITDLNANFTWKNLIYNGTTKYWEANFSLLSYEYGDYLLVINATDDKYNSSIEMKSISIHPLIAYCFKESEISYNDNGITVYTNELITTEIIANIEITHHSIVKERDFEIYIPEKFEDAHNYYISRGFDTYKPLGYFPDGIYTKWQIIDYYYKDIVYFNLEKPRLINELIEEDDDDVITMEFILDSKHSFTNLHIENQLTKYVTDPDNYIYTLYYLYAGDWEEVDDYDVEADVFPEFSFTWSYIGEDSVIRFKFKLEPIETEPSNMGGYIFFGFGILALVNVPFQIFGLATKKFRSRTEGEGWGMARYVGISIALAVGSFFGGFGIGYFVYG